MRKHKALKKLKGDDVSLQSKTQFNIDFGNVPDVTWSREDYYDVATFTKNGEKVKAYYDYDSQLLGTVVDKKFTDLPPKAQQYIKEKYKDYTIGDVILFTDNQANQTDMLLYGLEFVDENNYFVELIKDNKHIILKVNDAGDVSFFKELK